MQVHKYKHSYTQISNFTSSSIQTSFPGSFLLSIFGPSSGICFSFFSRNSQWTYWLEGMLTKTSYLNGKNSLKKYFKSVNWKIHIFMPQNAFMPCGLCDQLKLANSFWCGDTLNEFLLEKRADQEVFASANNFKQPISWRNQHCKHRKFTNRKRGKIHPINYSSWIICPVSFRCGLSYY